MTHKKDFSIGARRAWNYKYSGFADFSMTNLGVKGPTVGLF
jgi:hypothetical protein